MLKPFQEFGQQKLMMEVGSSDGKLEGDRSRGAQPARRYGRADRPLP